MNNRNELQGTKIYLDDDLMKETREKDKALKPMMTEEREQEFHAVIRLGKLYVEGVEYDEETAKVMERFINDKMKRREKKWKATKAKSKANEKQKPREEKQHHEREQENRGIKEQRRGRRGCQCGTE